MVSFNRVVLAGNLTRDPELRFTQEGVPVANFSIAVNRVRSKSEAVDFFNVSCWRELGERVANYKKKGDPIVVEGWTCPGTVDTFPSRSVLFFQSNLLELGRAQIA